MFGSQNYEELASGNSNSIPSNIFQGDASARTESRLNNFGEGTSFFSRYFIDFESFLSLFHT